MADTPFVPNLSTAQVKNEIPSGVIDGVNDTYILKNKPAPNTLILLLDGVRLAPETDYTLVGNTVILETAPAGGTVLLADYSFS